MRRLSALLTFLWMLSACQGERTATTQVTLNLGEQKKIAAKAGDIHIFVIGEDGVGGAEFAPIVAPVPAGETSVIMAIPNGAGRRLRVVAYVEKFFGEPGPSGSGSGAGMDFLPGLINGADYYEGVSEPLDLLGSAVTAAVSVSQLSGMVGVVATVVATNPSNSNDQFTYGGAKLLVRDPRTGFNYSPMLFTSSGAKVYPPILPPGRNYKLRAEVCGLVIEKDFTTPSDGSQFVTVPPITVPFAETQVNSAAQIIAAFQAANANVGLDVISIVGGASTPLIYNLTAPLPTLTDACGTMVRGLGNAELSGGALTGPISGIRLASSNNVVMNLGISNFPEFGVVVQGTATSPIQNNQLHQLKLMDNKVGGVEVVNAKITLITENDIRNNMIFGARLRGTTEFVKIATNKIKCLLSNNPSTDPQTRGIEVLDEASQISVGDFDLTAASASNIINNCTYGVRVKDNAGIVDIRNNIFGFDPDLLVDEPNRLAVFLNHPGNSQVAGNDFSCNGVAPPAGFCTLPALSPPQLSAGVLDGAVAVSAIPSFVEVRRNKLYHNVRGVLQLANSASFRLIEHNTFFQNTTGFDVDSNSTGGLLRANIFAGHDFIGSIGVRFANSSSVDGSDHNLFYNVGSVLQDCLPPPTDPTYCSNTVLAAVGANIACPSVGASGPCDPLLTDIIGTPPFDFALQTASPAVDAAGPGNGENVLGAGLDIGAIESH